MGEVRPPAVAGSFYPADAEELGRAVRSYVAQGRARPAGPAPKAVIAPHAGYVYSGPVAGSAFAALAPLRGLVARVVVLGPAHRGAFGGLALPRASAMETPLGVALIDPEAAEDLLDLPQVLASDRAHEGEHSLEVELPFIQAVLGPVSIVPLVFGVASDAEVSQVLEHVWGEGETCVVVSSDLSHYLPYVEGKRVDEATARAIEQLAPEEIGDAQACGRTGVRGLLRVARAHGLRATTLDLRSSGDTAGTRDRVVGYGAFAFG